MSDLLEENDADGLVLPDFVVVDDSFLQEESFREGTPDKPGIKSRIDALKQRLLQPEASDDSTVPDALKTKARYQKGKNGQVFDSVVAEIASALNELRWTPNAQELKARLENVEEKFKSQLRRFSKGKGGALAKYLKVLIEDPVRSEIASLRAEYCPETVVSSERAHASEQVADVLEATETVMGYRVAQPDSLQIFEEDEGEEANPFADPEITLVPFPTDSVGVAAEEDTTDDLTETFPNRYRAPNGEVYLATRAEVVSIEDEDDLDELELDPEEELELSAAGEWDDETPTIVPVGFEVKPAQFPEESMDVSAKVVASLPVSEQALRRMQVEKEFADNAIFSFGYSDALNEIAATYLFDFSDESLHRLDEFLVDAYIASPFDLQGSDQDRHEMWMALLLKFVQKENIPQRFAPVAPKSEPKPRLGHMGWMSAAAGALLAVGAAAYHYVSEPAVSSNTAQVAAVTEMAGKAQVSAPEISAPKTMTTVVSYQTPWTYVRTLEHAKPMAEILVADPVAQYLEANSSIMKKLDNPRTFASIKAELMDEGFDGAFEMAPEATTIRECLTALAAKDADVAKRLKSEMLSFGLNKEQLPEFNALVKTAAEGK